MNSGSIPGDPHLADFADPAQRQSAAAALAARLGGDDLVMFAPDPELGVLLPAPGFRQTLRGSDRWQSFLRECQAAGQLDGTLPAAGGNAPARGVAVPRAIAVLLGADAWEADLTSLRPLLTLLGALFLQERRAAAADVRVSAAHDAAERALSLTQAVQTMRRSLQASLAETEAARAEARAHADQAEALAVELQRQARHLEEQAAELETLNEALAARTHEAESARADAESADRAKSEFLANMSHELRTPINAIIGYSELLDMGVSGELSEEQRHHVDRVRASSRHLLTLINDVLDLAKIEAGQMTVEHSKWRVRPAITDAVGLLALEVAAHGVQLVDECRDTELSFFGDEDRVRQILANLLSNAVKFTEEGGVITIRCGSRDEPEIQAHLEGNGPWTFIEVEDTGIGMSPAEVASVFQPFVQAATGRTRAHGGTGLGLTISRQLARLMGGDLTLHSEPGVGSTLTLWLPRATARAGVLDESIRVGAS